MKSSISYKGLPEYPEFYGSLNYVYGLSDFWAYIFQDKELLDRTLEVQSYLYAEIYSRFLQLTSTISLDDIQTTFHTSIKLALIEQPVDDSGIEVEDLADTSLVSYTYYLPFKVLDSKYLLDRPILSRKTYEKDVHYNIIKDGDVLETFKPIGDMGFPVKRVSKNGKEYNQYAIWITDSFLDEDVVYKYFGQFVNVGRSTSTDLYRDFIRGLYFLYSNGPTIELLGRGLNLAIGIPFARDTEEVLEVVKDNESGNYNVVTSSNSYTIPYGIPPDFEPGDILPENVPLSNVAVIRDYRTDDEWWLNVSVPRRLLIGLPEDQPTLATQGSAIEFYMREYLKYHTFLVNVKVVASFTSESMEEVVTLINESKPSYTLPVFVWAVPLQEEYFVGQDDYFTLQPGLHLQEIMFYGEYIKRFQNIPGERKQTAWIRSNGNLDGYLGETSNVSHVVKVDPTLNTTVEVVDDQLIPLYNIDAVDLLNKLATLGYTLTIATLPERFEIQNVNAVTHYDTLIKKEATISTGVGYNNGDLDPFYGEIKRRFVPALVDLTTTETIVVMRVKSNLYSVFLKRAVNTLFSPVYFPPAEDDPLTISTTWASVPLGLEDGSPLTTESGDILVLE